MMRHVSLLRPGLWALSFGRLRYVRLRPRGWRRATALAVRDESFEFRQTGAGPLVLRKMGAPLVGGEGHGSNVAAFAHAEQGRSSRIEYYVRGSSGAVPTSVRPVREGSRP